MALSDDLIRKLKGKFEPSATTQFRYRSNDIVVQSDEEGNAIRAFIGKADEEQPHFKKRQRRKDR